MAFFRKHLGLILLTAISLALALAFALQTPSFALYRVARAVENRDLATFYSYVNLGAVLDSIEDAENTRRINKEAKSEWQALSQTLQSNIGKILKPKQVNLLQREIEGRFRGIQLPDAVDATFGNLLATRNFFREVESFELGSVARRGEEALVNLQAHVPNLKKTYALLLVLRQGDRWQISGLEGLASTLDEYARDQFQYLQDSVACNAGIKRESQLLGLQKSLIWELHCRNRRAETIVALHGKIRLSSGQGKVLKEFPLRRSPIAWHRDQLMSFSQAEDVGLFDSSAGDAFADAGLRIDLTIDDLQFRRASQSSEWAK